MGTPCTITLYANSEAQAAAASARAFDHIASLEATLSDYRENSEAMRVFRQAPGEWHQVSSDLATILAACQILHETTDGAFDPTLGPLTQLWRATVKSGKLPDPQTLEAARHRSGMDHLEVDRTLALVRFDRAGMRPDFGAIGKGLAADGAMAILSDSGHPAALIDFGGDLLAGDPPPTAPDGWRIEIRNGIGRPYQIDLANMAVATSGDLEQFVEIAGVRYSHIIDPRTGLGLTERRAATVLAPTGAEADALASAACVLGPRRISLLRSQFPLSQIDVEEIDTP
jgi:FAD:protein FMN transferase